MKNQTKYAFLGVMLCIAAMCLITGIRFYRLRGSIKVVPGADIAGTETVFYRQKDAQWSADHLGNSIYTMESSGCLVTCIATAMQMSDLYIADRDGGGLKEIRNPKELNQYFNQNNVYDSQGNIQWGQLEGLEDIQVNVDEEISAGLIEEYLRNGKYPVVRVRMKGYGNFHYVLVVSSRNGMFYCMDPLNVEDELVPLSNYNNRIYAIRCVYPEN